MQYLTDMENSPGALSLSRTRKAPHSLCLSRLSATQREIRPANQLERRINSMKVREEGGLRRGASSSLSPRFPAPRNGDNDHLDLTEALKERHLTAQLINAGREVKQMEKIKRWWWGGGSSR